MEDPYPTGKYPDQKVWVWVLFSQNRSYLSNLSHRAPHFQATLLKLSLYRETNGPLFKSLCNKRQFMRKNKFATLSGMFRAILFSHFEPKTLHNVKSWAATHLFHEVADTPKTRRKFLTALGKLVMTWFLSNPLHRDF